MKVYFGVNGVGRGHAIRSFRLAQELSKLGLDIYVSSYGDGYVTLKTLNSRNPCCRLLKLEGYSYVWLSRKLDWSRTLASSILNCKKLYRHLINEIKIVEEIKPDIIFSDSRISTCLAARMLDVKYFLITNQLSIYSSNPFMKFLLRRVFKYAWGSPENIFITDLPPPYTISYINTASVSHFFKSLEYVGLLGNRFKVDVTPYGERDIDILFIISAPTGDRESFYLDSLRLARILGKKGFKVILIGHGSNKGRYGNVFVEGWVKNSLDYLSRSKLVILRGGQTAILESILYKTPMYVVPAPFQTEQEGNAISVKRLGLGRYTSYTRYYLKPYEVAYDIVKMLDEIDRYRRNLEPIHKTLISIDGLKKIIELVKKSIL